MQRLQLRQGMANPADVKVMVRILASRSCLQWQVQILSPCGLPCQLIIPDLMEVKPPEVLIIIHTHVPVCNAPGHLDSHIPVPPPHPVVVQMNGKPVQQLLSIKILRALCKCRLRAHAPIEHGVPCLEVRLQDLPVHVNALHSRCPEHRLPQRALWVSISPQEALYDAPLGLPDVSGGPKMLPWDANAAHLWPHPFKVGCYGLCSPIHEFVQIHMQHP